MVSISSKFSFSATAAALSSLSWRSVAYGTFHRPQKSDSGRACRPSLSISSLWYLAHLLNLSPVILHSGRARLAIRPAPTGSTELVITMGMVVVAFLTANADVDPVTIRSTLRRTKSAIAQADDQSFAQANRYSMVMFFPSIHLACSALAGRVHENRDTGSSGIVQEPDAEDFSRLLRLQQNRKAQRA